MEYHKDPTVASLLDEFIVNFPCQKRFCAEWHKDPEKLYEWFAQQIELAWQREETRGGRFSERVLMLRAHVGVQSRQHFRVGSRGIGKRGAEIEMLTGQVVSAILNARSQPR